MKALELGAAPHTTDFQEISTWQEADFRAGHLLQPRKLQSLLATHSLQSRKRRSDRR